MNRGIRWCFTGLLLATAACSTTEYRYVPTGTEAGIDGLQGEATFPVPVKDSAGNVRVASLGVVDLQPKGEGDKIPALHLRITLSNQGSKDWQLHIRDQTVSFPNHPELASPLYANSNALLASDVAIPSKSLRTLDLFYSLPKGWHEAKDLPTFDFHWKIQQGNEQAEKSLSFARQEIPDYIASGYAYPYGPYVGLGWGDWWWGPSSGPYVNYRG